MTCLSKNEWSSVCYVLCEYFVMSLTETCVYIHIDMEDVSGFFCLLVK